MERYFRLAKYCRKINIGILLMLLISCSSIDKQRISPAYFEAYDAIRDYFFDDGNELLTASVIENIPYASAILKIGRGKPGLIILEKKIDDQEYWVSADGVYLVIRRGRIIQTSGLPNNLKFIKTNNKTILLEDKDYKNYMSYDQPPLFDLPVEVTSSFVKEEQVSLLNEEVDLYLVEEKISSRNINWKAKNNFWLDENGYVWKSEQNISPKLPTFYLEITKQPL